MKQAKWLVALTAVCGFSVVNAKVVPGVEQPFVPAGAMASAPAPSVSCTLNDTCNFPAESKPAAGKIVYFVTPGTGQPITYQCSLTKNESNGDFNSATVNARVYSGKDATFNTSEITYLTPFKVTFSVPSGADGQIKFELAAAATYPENSVGVTCAVATS